MWIYTSNARTVGGFSLRATIAKSTPNGRISWKISHKLCLQSINNRLTRMTNSDSLPLISARKKHQGLKAAGELLRDTDCATARAGKGNQPVNTNETKKKLICLTQNQEKKVMKKIF